MTTVRQYADADHAARPGGDGAGRLRPDWADQPRQAKYYPGTDLVPLPAGDYPAEATVQAGLTGTGGPAGSPCRCSAACCSTPTGCWAAGSGSRPTPTCRRCRVTRTRTGPAAPRRAAASTRSASTGRPGRARRCCRGCTTTPRASTPCDGCWPATSPPRSAAALGGPDLPDDRPVPGARRQVLAERLQVQQLLLPRVTMDVGTLLQTWRMWARRTGLRRGPGAVVRRAAAGPAARRRPGPRRACSRSCRCAGQGRPDDGDPVPGPRVRRARRRAVPHRAGLRRWSGTSRATVDIRAGRTRPRWPARRPGPVPRRRRAGRAARAGPAGRGRAGRAAPAAEQLRPLRRAAADQPGRARRRAGRRGRGRRAAHRRDRRRAAAGQAVRLRQPRRRGPAGQLRYDPAAGELRLVRSRPAGRVPAAELLPGQLQPRAGRRGRGPGGAHRRGARRRAATAGTGWSPRSSAPLRRPSTPRPPRSGLGCGVALGFDAVSYVEELGLADTGEVPLLIMMVGHETARRRPTTATRSRDLGQGRIPAPAAAGTRAGLGDAFMLRVAGLPVEAVAAAALPGRRRLGGRGAGRDRAAGRRRGGAERAARRAGQGGRRRPDRRQLLAVRRQVFNNAAARATRRRRSPWPPACPSRWAPRWPAGWPTGAGWTSGSPPAPGWSPPSWPGPGAELRALGRRGRLRTGCCWPRRRWTPSWTRTSPTPAAGPGGQADPPDRALGAVVPVPHGLQDQPVQHVHRRRARPVRATARAGSGPAGPDVDQPPAAQRGGAEPAGRAGRGRPGPRGDLPVTPSPGWQHDGDRVRYVRRTGHRRRRRGRGQLRRGRGPALLPAPQRRPGADARAASSGSRPYGCGELVAVAGGATPPPRSRRRDRYAGALLELGLLQLPALGTDVHDAGPAARASAARCGRSAGRGRAGWPSGWTARASALRRATRRPTRRRRRAAAGRPAPRARRGAGAAGRAGRVAAADAAVRGRPGRGGRRRLRPGAVDPAGRRAAALAASGSCPPST